VPARRAALTEWRGEKLHEGAGAPAVPAVRCLTTDEWKFVHYEGKPFGELNDSMNAPDELQNLADDPAQAETPAALRQELFRLRDEWQDGPSQWGQVFWSGYSAWRKTTESTSDLKIANLMKLACETQHSSH
jgi:hypothetical protein